MITELLNFLSIELTVMLTAALPIIELRGAIPVGMSLGMSCPLQKLHPEHNITILWDIHLLAG